MNRWRLNILVWIMAALPVFSFAQNIDTTAMATKQENLRVDSLNNLAEQYLSQNNFDLAESMARQALDLASSFEYRPGKGTALLILARSEIQKGNLPLALRNYFGALNEYEWLGDDEMMGGINYQISMIYKYGGLYDKALEYLGKARKLLLPREGEAGTTYLVEEIASCYMEKKEYDSALVKYKDLLTIYQAKGDIHNSLSVITQIVVCTDKLGFYSDALIYNQKAFELTRTLGDKEGEIAALNNIGYNYKYLSDYPNSLKYFTEASELEKTVHGAESTVTLVNLAIAEQNLGDFKASLNYLSRAIKLAEHANDIHELSRLDNLVANVYYIMKDYHNALVYNKASFDNALKASDAELLQASYLTSSKIYTALDDYESALDNYQKYLSIKDSTLLRDRAKQQDLMQQQYVVERAEKEIEILLSNQELENLELKRLRLESEKKQQDLELLKKTNDLQAATITNQDLEKKRAFQELLLAQEKLAAEHKDNEIKGLKLTQQLQEAEIHQRELEKIQQQKEIELLTKDKAISDLKLQRVRTRTQFLFGIFLLALVILFLVIRSYIFSRRTNRKLTDQRNKIQQQKEAIETQYDIIKVEREKSDKLLLNILPEETAAELKEKGTATPMSYEKVTVLFTDFVGFTKFAEKLTPEELILELDRCFLAFDHIIDKHNLEKIKTIGDSYMCAGGIPVANRTNPFDTVNAALEIKAFMDNLKLEKEKKGEAYWEIRIGVHTGPVVAGVVGKNKFAYDIWGDAVNTASRMESSGENNRVNISGETFEIIKDHFICTHRGKIKAKNKGEIDMYFVEGKKL